MNALCLQSCPVALDCRGAFDATLAAQQSFLSEGAALNAADRLAQNAHLAEGMAILSGDLTAEQSEDLHGQFQATVAASTGVIGSEQAMTARTELNADMKSHAVTMDTAAAGLAQLSEAELNCAGPKLNLLGNLALAFDALRSRTRPTAEDRHYFMALHAKCSSTAAKAALRSMPKP